MARTPTNQGANEAAVVTAVNQMVGGELNAINRVPAASQGEAMRRFEDRRDAGECRQDIVKTPPLAPGSN